MAEASELLLRYAREGDVESLSALVQRSSGWLTGFIRGLVPSETEAEDVLQEVWVRVIKSCGSYRGGSMRTYLVRVARSVVIDRFRRSGRQTPILDAENEEGASLGETLEAEDPPPDEAFETAATAEEVRLAVRELPKGQREVVMMRIEGELAFREIAEVMGIPLGTALTWMRAATLKLRERLGVKDEKNS